MGIKNRRNAGGVAPPKHTGGKPNWTPTATESAVLDELEAGDILALIYSGGAEKEKVRRWWMAKNPGSDVAGYFRQIVAWENEVAKKWAP